jgi:two-component system, NarL family, sensor kinase
MQTNNSQIIIFLFEVTILVVFLMTAIITMLYMHQNKRISFHDHLSTTQLEIQEETFQHISREIHDNIGLSLTLAKLHLNTLDFDPQQNPKDKVDSCIELITQAIYDLSYISKSFNSEAIQTEGFLTALNLKLEKIKKTRQYTVNLHIIGEPVFMQSQSELVIYRITQEALNNVIKHSKATQIDVTLTYSPNILTVEVQDNGIGINWQHLEKEKAVKMNAGLNNMKKRAKVINGSFDIKSTQVGTKVCITIPFQKTEK